MTKSSKAYRDLEILVVKIQQQLAPDATVVHNTKLLGQASKKRRQIDVLLTKRIGQYELRVVIECKDHKRAVDVAVVDAFHSLLLDVQASKGAMVSPRGFTAAAKRTAASRGIELYSPVDTDPHKWTVKVGLPTVCDFTSAKFSFAIAGSDPMPVRIPEEFWSIDVYNDGGLKIGTAASEALKKWNDGELPTQAGEHHDIPIFGSGRVLVDNGYGQMMPVDLTVSLIVERQIYFGYLPLTSVSGFRDEISGNLITKRFTTAAMKGDEIAASWLKINMLENAPIPPVMRFVGRFVGSDETQLSPAAE